MNDREINQNRTANKMAHILFFSIPNSVGIVLYLPLLLGVLMMLGSPGGGEHWSHWLWASTNVLLGPMCLIGLIFKKRRYYGWIGYGIVLFSWSLFFGLKS